MKKRYKRRIGARVISTGENWEIVIGGIDFLYIPKNSRFNLDEFFQELGYHPTEIVEGE
jgi:hypothetical protein